MIIGFKCPYLNKYVSFEQCYRCRHRTSNCISKYFIKLMIPRKEKKWNVIYPSTELSCPRKAILERIVHSYIDYKAIKKIIDGLAYHKLMEENDNFDDNLDVESSFTMNIDDYEIHGRIDGYDKKKKLLYDWKFTGSLKYIPYEKHLYQISLYKMMLENEGIEVKQAELRYISFFNLNEVDVVLEGDELDELITQAQERLFIFIDALIKAEKGYLVDGIQSDECNFCQFKFVCNAGNDLNKVKKMIEKSREVLIIKDEDIVLE